MSSVKSSADRHPLVGELGRNWGWMLALGILFIGLGIIGMGMLFGLTIVSVLFLGVLMLIGGVAQLLETLKCRGWKGVVWHLLTAVLYIVGGILVIRDPVLASKAITLVIAGVLVAVGLVRIVMAMQLRGTGGRAWLVLAGVISIALGLMIMAKWPISGLFVIGLFVAVEMLMQGFSYVAVALAARQIARAGAW